MRSFFGLCIVFFSACILSISMFAPVSLSSQPPIDTTTFYEGTIGWGPGRADPARAYDTGSGKLIFNVYENLIALNREQYWAFVPTLATNVPDRTDVTLTITNTSVIGADPVDSTWTDGANSYTSMGYFDYNGLSPGFGQGDVIYMFDGTVYRTWFIETLSDTSSITLNLWRGSYTFNIRASPTIYFWNETGAAVDIFDVDDAEYSFKRGLVQDTGPQWMFYKPLFGTMNSNPFASNLTAPTVMTLAHLIDNAVEKNGNELTINLGIRYSDNVFKQTLSNTWGSIVSKEFSISIVCWNADLYSDGNGDGYPDWWTTARGISRSPYDTTSNFRYAGTGPYRVATFNPAGNVVVMQKNPSYWRGWPAAGSNSSLGTIEIDYIADWTVRKNAFLSGAIDTCAVPRANMFELLSPTTKEPDLSLDPYMKTIKNLSPSLSLDAVHFTFTINPVSPFIGTGSFPNGIPTNFFNNTYVRKAFAYSFNQTNWIQQMWFGEACRQYTPLIEGLYPDYRTVTSGYDVNFASAEAELKQAMFGGQSVWNTGFTITLVYSGSGGSERIKMLMIKDFFMKLSTYDGRVGNPFTVNVAPEIDWLTYLQDFENFLLPTFDIGWLADFADADNFVRPYMHSGGDFSFFQNYTLTNGWESTHGSNYPALNKDELIDKAFATPDGSDRAKMYQDLESIYMADCPSLPMPAPTGRRWCQYWVKGWYYNPLYPGDYYYTMWKADVCWFDITGMTVAVSNGISAMRDIQYLIARFNAKAPRAGKPLDVRWVGVYGANGCVDPYGDRTCNMRDIQQAIVHFNHKMNTTTP
ncbi:MAG TPA: ABC transporter substrate-binding protein [Patescibacteria group bacterium]|nr:ABC transporter substrate-binding protein [Patescibacteria group bacterium]